MSKHRITKPAQLRVNGKEVKELGRKARIRDAGLRLGQVLAGRPTDEQLKTIRAKSEERAAKGAERAAATSGTSE